MVQELRIDDKVLECVVGGAVPLELNRADRFSRLGNRKKVGRDDLGPNMPDEVETSSPAGGSEGAIGLQQL